MSGNRAAELFYGDGYDHAPRAQVVPDGYYWHRSGPTDEWSVVEVRGNSVIYPGVEWSDDIAECMAGQFAAIAPPAEPASADEREKDVK